ncbi:MAG: circularly permuted type 2 ATP-grasp protein [Phaeodactylibacter sp.]|nr:circularly permuted type 2 ATP-grasp protein [Phaeodactylibacter sp.]
MYRNGKVALANAPGTGVADDKVVYAYVPRIIEYYLKQEAIIPNVHTYICEEAESRKYVLENIEQLVVKYVPAGLPGVAAGRHHRLSGPRPQFPPLHLLLPFPVGAVPGRYFRRRNQRQQSNQGGGQTPLRTGIHRCRRDHRFRPARVHGQFSAAEQ